MQMPRSGVRGSGSEASGGGCRARTAANQLYIKALSSNIPKFDGSGNVEGYFETLEIICERMGVEDEGFLDYLLGNI